MSDFSLLVFWHIHFGVTTLHLRVIVSNSFHVKLVYVLLLLFFFNCCFDVTVVIYSVILCLFVRYFNSFNFLKLRYACYQHSGFKYDRMISATPGQLHTSGLIRTRTVFYETASSCVLILMFTLPLLF